MNTLIVNTNRYDKPVPVMPVGVCIVAEEAERAGHRVRVLDLIFEQDPLAALEEELKKAEPDIIGLSIRNIDNGDMQNPVMFYKELGPLADTIRSRTNAPIVLGGPGVSIMPEELLRYTGADWAVLENGEIVFPRLLTAISQGHPRDRIPGIGWLEDNRLMKNPDSISFFSGDSPAPELQRWIDVRAYLSRLATVPIQTKRGCPFKCVYCTYPKIEGSDYRLYTPESVIESIRNIVSMGARDIEFVDNVFNSPYDHAMAVCEGLARIRTGARLQSLELNPLFVDDALLTVMEKAGFVSIGLTVESASDNALDGLRKDFTSEDVHKAARAVHRHKLPCLWIFMFGGPGETKETVLETLSFAESFVRPKDVAFFTTGIRIYPGTEIENIARNERVIAHSSDGLLKPVFYISPAIDAEWLIKEVHNAMAAHLNYIDSDSVSLPFLPAIHRIGYRLGIKPPLWKYTRTLRRGLKLIGAN